MAFQPGSGAPGSGGGRRGWLAAARSSQCRSAAWPARRKWNTTVRSVYGLTFTPAADLEVNDIRLELPLRPEAAAVHSSVRAIRAACGPRSSTGSGRGHSTASGSAPRRRDCTASCSAAPTPARCSISITPRRPARGRNGGQGGVTVRETAGAVLATAFSGPRKLKAGRAAHLRVLAAAHPGQAARLPRPISKARYYHTAPTTGSKDGRGNDPEPPAEALAAWRQVVNLHHASIYNPYINYPFIRTRELDGFHRPDARRQGQGQDLQHDPRTDQHGDRVMGAAQPRRRGHRQAAAAVATPGARNT